MLKSTLCLNLQHFAVGLILLYSLIITPTIQALQESAFRPVVYLNHGMPEPHQHQLVAIARKVYAHVADFNIIISTERRLIS